MKPKWKNVLQHKCPLCSYDLVMKHRGVTCSMAIMKEPFYCGFSMELGKFTALKMRIGKEQALKGIESKDNQADLNNALW